MSRFWQVLLLIAVTLIPALELRASIPFGMLYGSEHFGIDPNALSWPVVVLVCVMTNIILGWCVFFVLHPIFRLLDHCPWFHRLVVPIMTRMQGRLKPYVEKYGELGVALFIGVPLPGSGVYTGAVGAFLLGLDRRKFVVANVVGVLIAGTAVTLICFLLRMGVDFGLLRFLIKGNA